MRALRFLPAFLLVASTLPHLGCARAINAMTSSPDFRKGVNEKGKASCVQAATAQVPVPASAKTTKQIDAYCECFTVKGLSQFSNAELMELGLNKEKMKDPKFEARMTAAADTCRAEAFHE